MHSFEKFTIVDLPCISSNSSSLSTSWIPGIGKSTSRILLTKFCENFWISLWAISNSSFFDPINSFNFSFSLLNFAIWFSKFSICIEFCSTRVFSRSRSGLGEVLAERWDTAWPDNIWIRDSDGFELGSRPASSQRVEAEYSKPRDSR